MQKISYLLSFELLRNIKWLLFLNSTVQHYILAYIDLFQNVANTKLFLP